MKNNRCQNCSDKNTSNCLTCIFKEEKNDLYRVESKDNGTGVVSICENLTEQEARDTVQCWTKERNYYLPAMFETQTKQAIISIKRMSEPEPAGFVQRVLI